MGFVKRTRTCGELRLEHTGQTVSLNGWAHRVRDLGGVLFVDLRDRNGLVQLTFDPSAFKERPDIRTEACLSITGNVKERAEATKNPKMATGDIEVVVTSFTVLGESKPLPFPISDEEQMLQVNEELRVKHRYLDLRRPSMYRRLAIRASAIRRMREYLNNEGFLEVETPIITKSTPEGARDYLVAYRQEPGMWYALPQSPQQYKQLLMVAGIERYYQVARCFRDESSRADRLPEFTQLDMELSFITQADIMALTEDLTRTVLNGVIDEFGLEKQPVEAFPVMTYDEAMEFYGCDKPDARFDLRLFDLSGAVGQSGFSVFRNAVESGAKVRGVLYPGGGSLSRAEIAKLDEFAKGLGAKGLAWLAVEADGSLRGSIAKFFTPEELASIVSIANANPGDLICMIADDFDAGNKVLYRLRLEIGDRCGLRDPSILKYLWVIDFPLVEWDNDGGRWSSMHHPFTMPKEEDLNLLETDPGKIRAQAYDLVCNGYECAGGSIRINRSDIQARIFSLLGIDEATQKSEFGHLLDAFSFGAPPHGGIAPGIDRIAMILTDTENIREVVAFPKIAGGSDPMMGSPSAIDPAQWAELGLRVVKL
jgi:aspartyl-tRNA synthetase